MKTISRLSVRTASFNFLIFSFCSRITPLASNNARYCHPFGFFKSYQRKKWNSHTPEHFYVTIKPHSRIVFSPSIHNLRCPITVTKNIIVVLGFNVRRISTLSHLQSNRIHYTLQAQAFQLFWLFRICIMYP